MDGQVSLVQVSKLLPGLRLLSLPAAAGKVYFPAGTVTKTPFCFLYHRLNQSEHDFFVRQLPFLCKCSTRDMTRGSHVY